MLEDKNDPISKEHINTISSLLSCPLFPIRMSTLCVNLTIINTLSPSSSVPLGSSEKGDEEGSLSQDAMLSLHSDATLAISNTLQLCL